MIGAFGTVCLTGAAGCLASSGDPNRNEHPTAEGENAAGDGNATTRDSPHGTDGAGEETEAADPPGVELGPETFEHLSALEAVGGRLAADTERQVTGTQCAALETGADGAWLHVPLAEPVDFSNARVACHVAVDGTAAGEFLYLDLRDGDSNRFRTRTVLRSRNELVRVDFGIVDPQVDDVAVDLARITRLSFRAGPRKESGTETVYLDHPRRIPTPETAKVVFQFDDGNLTDYTEGFPYLSQYGYPAITYVNTETIGNEGKLDESKLAELQRENWLIGSHTTDHTDLTSLSDPAEIERRVRDAKGWLVDRGFDDGARHFAYPYNAVNEQVLSIVSEFHDTGRVWNWQPGALPSNPQLIPAEGDPDPATFRNLLTQTVRYGGVLILTHHGLPTDSDRSDFHEIVDEVHRRDQAGDVDVVRLDELQSMAADALSR
ncbi:polysaccharide deacetylase family protein [Halorubrum sp. CBA1125]|uniref:polysaccharide deacetylase family protein n=1 Tax=Halorubrum sp. CBA1125 TaxID=2668072 RepID=UPI0018D26EB4|nr:polysaccharide deacetylase family protein [Halorubrum sp. CBA1125]